MAEQTVVLAGGCFWGLQELLREEPGVVTTEVGYAGGENHNPTYDYHPGHAEAVSITYDDTKTSYIQLLDAFFRMHDPTTRNRQGNDIGSSYRSAIFYESVEQKKVAEAAIVATNESGFYPDPVVTSLEPLDTFYAAEDYHQDYLRKHPGGYTCHYVRQEAPLFT